MADIESIQIQISEQRRQLAFQKKRLSEQERAGDKRRFKTRDKIERIEDSINSLEEAKRRGLSAREAKSFRVEEERRIKEQAKRKRELEKAKERKEEIRRAGLEGRAIGTTAERIEAARERLAREKRAGELLEAAEERRAIGTTKERIAVARFRAGERERVMPVSVIADVPAPVGEEPVKFPTVKKVIGFPKKAVERLAETIRPTPVGRAIIKFKKGRPEFFEPGVIPGLEKFKMTEEKIDKSVLGITNKAFSKAGETLLIVSKKITDVAGEERIKKTITVPVLREFLFETQIPREEAVESVARVLKFGFFTPALLTGGEQLASFPEKTRVEFAGVEQKIQRGLVKTKIAFQTKKEVGIAAGISRIKAGRDVQVAATKSGGAFLRARVEVPTGRIIVSKQRVFVGAQKTISQGVKATLTVNKQRLAEAFRGFRSITVGAVRRLRPTLKLPTGRITFPKPEKFIGVGAGITKKDISLIFTEAVTKKASKIISVGAIKKVSAITSRGVRIAGKVPRAPATQISQRAVQELSRKAAQDVSQIAGATVARAPGVIIKVPTIPAVAGVAVVSAEQLSSRIKDLSKAPLAVRRGEAPMIPERRATVRQITSQLSKQTQAVAQKQRQKLLTKQAQKQHQQQRQVQVQAQQQKQQQRLRQTLTLQVLQRGRETQKQALISPTIPRFAIPPPLPIVFPTVRGKRRRVAKRVRRKAIEDITLPAGFTARVAGLVKVVEPKELRALERRLSKAIAIRPTLIVKRKRKKK